MMKERWNKEPQNSPDRECIEYFREKPVFDRLLRGFRKKYASYGSFAGTVVLQNVTREDIENLEGFFQRNYHGQKSVSVSAERFEKAFRNSKYGKMTPKELLELYFGEEMTGKGEQKREEERRWLRMLEQMLERYAGTPAGRWICGLKSAAEERLEEKSLKADMSAYLMKRYRESGKNPEEMQKILHLASEVINHFPYRQGNREYLAMFAAMLTGNPHAFDEGTRDGKLLSLLAQWNVENRKKEIEKSEIFPAMHRQRLYLAVGILKDDISNYAMVSGILAWKKNGEIHMGMDGFGREGDMVQVPLSVIAGWERVECPEQTIYIVENPSVYAMLCGKWRGKRACMCMNGQPRLSSVLMLDLLAEAGVKVYYAGDFDPEGLLIAQKIRQYYGGEFEYWHMSKQVYEKSRSEEQLSQRRRKMLERITDPELAETAEAVAKNGLAGYQENVWDLYCKPIK
ncbi:MAG: TIGR02679 domain-containing protein [Lachnospiraceae bacterium]